MVSLSIDLQLACRLHAHAGESLRQVQSQRELHSATLDDEDTSAHGKSATCRAAEYDLDWRLYDLHRNFNCMAVLQSQMTL